MTESVAVPSAPAKINKIKMTPFRRWLLEGFLPEMEGPHERKGAHKQPTGLTSAGTSSSSTCPSPTGPGSRISACARYSKTSSGR